MANGEKISVENGVLNVPNKAVIPYNIGDGTGPDIWHAASRVLEESVNKAYNGEKSIVWKEVLAGQKAFDETGEWLPEESVTSKACLHRLNALKTRTWSSSEKILKISMQASNTLTAATK